MKFRTVYQDISWKIYFTTEKYTGQSHETAFSKKVPRKQADIITEEVEELLWSKGILG